MADLATIQRAQEALEIAFQISNILDTGLDKETLAILIGLIETGVNPEALASVVRELRREGAALKEAEKQQLQQQLQAAAGPGGASLLRPQLPAPGGRTVTGPGQPQQQQQGGWGR